VRITKITIKDFYAFKDECVIELPKRNLLLYGENGSGKSSLYQALNLFFAPATPFGDHKNIFVTTDEGFVKLEIGDGTNPTKTYEWEATTHPFTETLIAEASKTKGFLDYRSLLETHFVHRRTDSVNIFDLLVNNLLANIENPDTHRPFREDWDSIQRLLIRKKYKSLIDEINHLLSDFNVGLHVRLIELEAKANEILRLFEQNVSVELSLAEDGLIFDSASKKIEQQDIILTVDYYGKRIQNHHHFLNEARLSAIAISIYLGALLLNPQSRLRVLFFDDVLIGLDMSNRLPLLDILNQFFPDWQVILATYDRVWFDMVWQRVMHSGTWERGELYCCRDNECDVPVYKGNTEYLVVAQQHLDKGDLKAAAIYIRSAYEAAIKDFCDRCHLLVPYFKNMEKQKSNDFWQVVKKQKLKTGGALLSTSVVKDVEFFRSTIMNQLSHTAPINLVRKEVEEAHKAVRALQETLRQVKRSGLQ